MTTRTMSDKRTTGGAPVPRRAEPLQPDRPGRGDRQQPPSDADPDPDHAPADSADRQRQQSEDAIGNVRDGYGLPRPKS